MVFTRKKWWDKAGQPDAPTARDLNRIEAGIADAHTALLARAVTTTVTSGGTLTLTATSSPLQILTGSSNHTVVLATTSVVAGQPFTVLNMGTTTITVQTSSGATAATLPAGQQATFIARIDTPTTTAHWATAVSAYLRFLATASSDSVALRDTNCNLLADNFIPTKASTVTSAGTLTLTIDSAQVQELTGTTTHTVKLSTTSITAGMSYTVVNNSSGLITVQSSAGNTIDTVSPGTTKRFVAQTDTPTTAAHWQTQPYPLRVTSLTPGSTLTPNADTSDQVDVIGLNTAATIDAPTGTPVDGQRIRMRISDDGSNRGLTWNAVYNFVKPIIAPANTGQLLLYVDFAYNTTTSKWDCVASTYGGRGPRVTSTASSGTPTPNVDYLDIYEITALAADATIGAPNGQAVNGRPLTFRIKDNGTSRALTWNSAYQVIGVTLPTATTAGKWIYVSCIYNSTASKWDVISVQQQA